MCKPGTSPEIKMKQPSALTVEGPMVREGGLKYRLTKYKTLKEWRQAAPTDTSTTEFIAWRMSKPKVAREDRDTIGAAGERAAAEMRTQIGEQLKRASLIRTGGRGATGPVSIRKETLIGGRYATK